MKVFSIFNAAAAKTVAVMSAVGLPTMVQATNWGGATGPTVGKVSENVASSMVGIAAGFEAFLYLLGIVFIVLFLLAAWKYKKSDGRDGNMGLIATYLVLATASMAAPTVMGSGMATLFGGSTVERVSAPKPAFTP
jgi:hypothetical protein